MANCKLCNQVCKGFCHKLSWESGDVPGSAFGGRLLSLGPRGHRQGLTTLNLGCPGHRDPGAAPQAAPRHGLGSTWSLTLINVSPTS